MLKKTASIRFERERHDYERRRTWRGVRSFLYWWRSELLMLLPAAVCKRIQQMERHIILELNDESLRLIECRSGDVERVRDYPLSPDGSIDDEVQRRLLKAQEAAGNEVVIRIHHEDALLTTLFLPLEAERNLPEVLGYEMDRNTPFKPAQVYYDYKIVQRFPERKRLSVELTVVPRSRVEHWVNRVRDWGVHPEAVNVADASGAELSLCTLYGGNLLPTEERYRFNGSRSLLNRGLGVSALLLALVVVLYPIIWQSVVINDLENRIATTREEALSTESLREEIQQLVDESRLLLEQRHQYPSTLDALKELTVILPDDTWLERFEQKGTGISVHGLSEDASSLIKLMETSPVFHEVAFDSPIVKDPRSERFRFQIVAQLSRRDAE